MSFAYCTTWSSLDRFTGFVRKTRRGKQVRKLRLNFQREEQGSKLWMTALRLWEVCPCLPGIDLDGQLTVSELYTVLNGVSSSPLSSFLLLTKGYRRHCLAANLALERSQNH